DWAQRVQVDDRDRAVAAGIRQQVGVPADGIAWASVGSETGERDAFPRERLSRAALAGEVEPGHAAVLKANDQGRVAGVDRHDRAFALLADPGGLDGSVRNVPHVNAVER